MFNNLPVDDSLLLGESENAGEMVEELAYSGKTLYGAAVIGFMKKTLGIFFFYIFKIFYRRFMHVSKSRS